MNEQLDFPVPTSSHRFFRAPEFVYDGAREHFIKIFNQPKNGTTEPFPVFKDPKTIKDKEGFGYVALLNSECDWPEVAEIIQDMLDSGHIEEVSQEDYLLVLNSNPSQD